MKTIDAFNVDHDKIKKGMYISRIDDDIITYDIRMVKPNTPPYLENAGLHSFEHIFTTFMRNTEFGQNIVYIGPMGCRTGFYLLTKGISNDKVIKLTKEAMDYISKFEGEVPGSKKSECGNYLEHDLSKAREYASDMKEILKDWKESDLKYY